jgi:predicted transcriptional regulator
VQAGDVAIRLCQIERRSPVAWILAQLRFQQAAVALELVLSAAAVSMVLDDQ